MIRLIGTGRLLLLLSLVGANILLAGAAYMGLMPYRISREREMGTLKGQVSTLRADIESLQVAFEQLAEQQQRFDTLKSRGFFFDQDRHTAETMLEKMQKESGVSSALVTIQPGTAEENENAAKSDHALLVSPAEIALEAFDTIDVFRYLYLLERYFPGHVSIEDITMERKMEVNGAVLREIASGGNPPLVEAEIKLKWRTMIPENTGSESPPGGSP